MSLTKIRSSSSNLEYQNNNGVPVLKTMTIFDKKTNEILFKTTGDDAHLDRYGKEVHKKLDGRNDFRVLIEDAPLLGFDFADVKEVASKITVERVVIAVNLLINIFLVFKLLGK